MTREYYMFKFFIDTHIQNVWNIEAIYISEQENKIVRSNNLIIEIDINDCQNLIFFNDYDDVNVDVPDLTLLSEEEFFQLSLVYTYKLNNNRTKTLECIREIQKKLKDEYFLVTEKLKENKIDISILWKEIIIEY